MNIIIYIFISLGLLFLILFCIKRNKESSLIAIILKTLTSLCFILTSCFSLISLVNKNLDAIANNTLKITPLVFIIIGLVCGLIGDIVLDFKIYFEHRNQELEGKQMTIFGMISFAIGHVFYISSLIIGNIDKFNSIYLACIITACAVCLLFIMCLKVMKMNFKDYLIISIMYSFLLLLFTVFSIFVIVDNFSIYSMLILIGSIFFLISDLVLSLTYFSKDEDYKKVGMFNPESKFFIVINHVTYYIAQFIIAISILFYI